MKGAPKAAAPAAPVTFETGPCYRGRPLMIEHGKFSLKIREKGHAAESAYDVPYEAVFTLGAKIAARERETRKAGAR